MSQATTLAVSAFEAVCKERDDLRVELEQYRYLAEKVGATKAVSQLEEAKSAIKDAHWQLLAFLKPGDEKTKAIIERLQKFL